MKCKGTGFTIVELLTSIAIIAILVGLLIPSLRVVRNVAKNTKQKAQLAAIGQSLMAFKNDMGYYPDSKGVGFPSDYSGAQKLAEALVGWDLMGFHPDSTWSSDGLDINGGEYTYDPANRRGTDSLEERVGPYMSLGNANAFRLDQLFNNLNPLLAELTYVICDSFTVRKITLPGVGKRKSETVKAGTPILYYKANTSSKLGIYGGNYRDRIYNVTDNMLLIQAGRLTSTGQAGDPHEFEGQAGQDYFYDYITDLTVLGSTERKWPYNPDSYILISAGIDGLYGTEDDITNF